MACLELVEQCLAVKNDGLAFLSRSFPYRLPLCQKKRKATSNGWILLAAKLCSHQT